MSKVVSKNLKISDMHCASCAMNIDFDLEDLPGVKSARTSFAKQESVIEIDTEEVNMKDVLKVIEKLGYQAKII